MKSDRRCTESEDADQTVSQSFNRLIIIFVVVLEIISVTNDVLLASAKLLIFQLLVSLAAREDTSGSARSVEFVLRFGEVSDSVVARLGHNVLLHLLQSRHHVAGRGHVYLAVGLLVHLHLSEVFGCVEARAQRSLRLRLVDHVELLTLRLRLFVINELQS